MTVRDGASSAHTARGSLVFSAVHVAGMLGLRKWVYSLAGQNYDFDSLAVQAFYEYKRI